MEFKLEGRIPINTDINSTKTQDLEELNNLNIKPGGQWEPDNCTARHKVAIIVPYRNRENILNIFLRHMHPFLSKQFLDYGIYLVEPLENLTFNRGLLMNIGFIESLNITNDKWDCFIFHDVDLIPEDDRIFYVCSDTPRHMSSAVSKFKYELPYIDIFGGAVSVTKEQMKKVNGYSNLFFGWGGEDDDFRNRITEKGFKITRYSLEIGRYFMLFHKKDQWSNSKRKKLVKETSKRMPSDGLNSIQYEIVKIEKHNLFTRFFVNYNEKEILKKFKIK